MDTELEASALVFSEAEFPTPKKYCDDNPDKSYSTLNKKIRTGKIPLHKFPGVPFLRLRASQATQVMESIKRPYTNPDVKIIHHELETDLFAPKVA